MHANINISYSDKKKKYHPLPKNFSEMYKRLKIKQCIFLYLPILKVVEKPPLELQVTFEKRSDLTDCCFSQELLACKTCQEYTTGWAQIGNRIWGGRGEEGERERVVGLGWFCLVYFLCNLTTQFLHCNKNYFQRTMTFLRNF